MKITFLFSLSTLAILSCSNPGKKEELDRKNLYQAQFFYEQGFPGRAMQHAKRIKETSPRYNEAQEWVSRIEGDQVDAESWE